MPGSLNPQNLALTLRQTNGVEASRLKTDLARLGYYKMIELTQAEYTALAVKDPEVFYLIKA